MDLFSLVKELAFVNDCGFKLQEKWPAIKNLPVLERQAKKLPDNLLDVFVDGELEEVKNITEDLDIVELNDFLNAVFNNDIEILLHD